MQSIDRDPSFHYDPATALIRRLGAIYRPTPHDVVELSFDSHGNVGALVHPQSWMPGSRIEAALRLSGLSPNRRAGLVDLHQRIPSRLHAIRLFVDGGASLFWPIDLPTKAVETLCHALASAEEAERVHRFFTALGRPACGFAYEVATTGAARGRFYAMAHSSAGDLDPVIAASQAHLGLGDEIGQQIRSLWQRASPRGGVVVNIEPTGPSIKLELPGASFELAKDVAAAPCERRLVRTIVPLAQRLGLAMFNYLGVRFHRNGRRSITTYVDAHACLEPTSAP